MPSWRGSLPRALVRGRFLLPAMFAPCFLDAGGAVGVEDGGRLGEELIGRLAEQVVAEVAARKFDKLLLASRKRCAMEGFGEHDDVEVMASNSLEKFFLTRHNDKDKKRSLLVNLHWRVTQSKHQTRRTCQELLPEVGHLPNAPVTVTGARDGMVVIVYRQIVKFYVGRLAPRISIGAVLRGSGVAYVGDSSDQRAGMAGDRRCRGFGGRRAARGKGERLKLARREAEFHVAHSEEKRGKVLYSNHHNNISSSIASSLVAALHFLRIEELARKWH
ncbi:hypothetical protein B0T26DRAFT_670064 [Lasiosphaeria miniovina]|uniref:Uncharacterized protein n=1 Tax=Lasiosphaeria miniovina TaxID=1954250 RepID=A0AA40BG86_9PEZI|nr:uncharacterized protein B0T26DRAFT_670064 [Lasiosphaeria miniovina]KAK0733680.1 hypothetical protein B0T26DRAFT_670064 [Lasiosphaeria miniovina]